MRYRTSKSIVTDFLTVSCVSRPAQNHGVRLVLAVSLFVACFLLASPAEAAPSIQLMTPQSGPVGMLVTMVGSGFGTSQGTSTVTFNGKPVTWASWSSSSLQVQVPAGATSGNVVVTVSGKASNTKSFTVTPTPAITGLSAASGPVGTNIVITGSNFTAGGTQSPQIVFNPEVFTSPISSTDTSITVAVPTGAATGDLLVSVGGGNSNAVLFTVTSSNPSISSLTPVGGVVGAAVTITGTNFGSSPGASTVTFNGTTGTPTSWNATSISVPVPAGATTGNVVVTVGGVASNPYGFEVGAAAPNIASISPSSGAVATAVTIKGTGFGATQGANTVNFNGVSGVPTSWSATQIKVPVPTGATTGSVVVTAGGTVSNGISFTIPGTGPSVASLSPSSGPIGTSVTITGTNFGGTQGASTVAFNGAAATATGWSPTSIVATVPSGATSGNVLVAINGTASNGLNFTVAPSITSLSPTSGGGGTMVTITGTSLGSSQGASTVTFNGTVGTPTSWSASSIVVPVPAGATTGNVVVTVNGIPSVGSSFTVAALTSITLTPAMASVSVGKTLQLMPTGTYSDGSNLNLGSTATWSSSAPSIASINSTGLATAVAVGQTTVQATVGSLHGSATLGVVNQTLTGSLPTAMGGNTLTVLEDSAVLVAGGYDSNGQSFSSSEIYNSATGSFVASANLNAARSGHTATLLNNGTVLIVGGFANGNVLASAELYNAATGTFIPTGNLNTARSGHTATILPSGQVLITGGADNNSNSLSSAELYDPVAGTFTSTGSLNTARQGDTATLLSNGMVLIAGGGDASGNVFQSAELYNPTTAAFSATGNMIAPRAFFTATLLNNGLVLMAGGLGSSLNSQASVELYNPATGTFTSTGNLNSARSYFTATLLNNGTVLVAGGLDASGNVLGSAELYDPVSATFTFTSSFVTARYVDTAILLTNGNVLETGGLDSNFNRLASAELYQPSTLTPPGLVSITVNSLNPTILVGAAQSFVATGTFSDSSTQVLASATWSSSTAAVASISNDATNYGTANALAVGSASINACAGSICGSNSLTIAALGSTPSITSLSPASGSVGTVVTITGSNFGAPQGSNTVAFNGMIAVTTGWTASSISVLVPNGSSTGNVIVSVSGLVSNGVSFTVLPSLVSFVVQPSIAGMLVGGTQQFTSTGTYSDGSSQDLTASTAWTSYNPGIATISTRGLATGITSGTASFEASFGSASAGVTLTVAGASMPPTITAQVSPPPNASGWNDSIVMVTFTCTPGSANVVVCPSSQTVTTEGINQVVSGTVTDATGANTTTSVTLNIERTPPTLAVSTPIDQSVVLSSSLTASGTLINSLTPVSGVTCNGNAASFGSSSFTCNVGLNPGLNLLSIIAKDVAGNAVGIRLHVTDSTALATPASLQITPVAPFISVGGTQQFTAVDQLGHPRTDATWTVDNTSIATISTGSSPLLTGIAGGQVTLTASVGSVSTQTQVTVVAGGIAPPVGSIVWSSPFLDGYQAGKIVPVMPLGGSSLDVVSIDVNANEGSTLLQGFSNSGQQVWQTTLADGLGFGMGDNFGGIFARTSTGFADIDGSTGSVAWVSDLPPNSLYSSTGAVAQDGAVYVFDVADEVLELMRIDPNSGHGTPVVLLGSPVGGVSAPMVAPDGSIYLEYFAFASDSSQTGYLLKLASDGSTSTQILAQTMQYGSNFEMESIVPDGQGGILAAWAITTSSASVPLYQVLDTTSGSIYSFTPPTLSQCQIYHSPYGDPCFTIVLGGDGTTYATDGATIWSFDPRSGRVNWTSQPPGGLSSMFAAQGGGIFVIDEQFDALQISSSGSTNTIGNQSGWWPAVVSASGRWYATNYNGSSLNPGLVQFALPFVLDEASSWPETLGNPEIQSGASSPVFEHFFPVKPATNVTWSQIAIDFRDFVGNTSRNSFFNNNPANTTNQATRENFIAEAKNPVFGLGFIGHSIYSLLPIGPLGAPKPVSYGICFTDVGINPRQCIVGTPDPTDPELDFGAFLQIPPDLQVDLIQTNARVVFAGACFTGKAFDSLWGIPQGTQGRALVAPLTPENEVDLSHAVTAWEIIVKDLTKYNVTVAVAVQDANNYMSGQNYIEQWQVIGDGSVCPIQKSCKTQLPH